MTSSLLTIYAHVRPSLSTLETTLCLSVSISVRFTMESFYHFCYISLYPKSLFSYLPSLLFQFTLYSFFLFSLSQSFSICLIHASSLCHIRYTVTSLFLFRFILQCLPYPVFAHLFSSCLRQEMLKLTAQTLAISFLNRISRSFLLSFILSKQPN